VDERTLIIVVVVIAVILLIVSAAAAYFCLRWLARQQESWEEHRRSARRLRPVPGDNADVVWMGVDVERRLQDEIRELERAGYRSRLVRLEEGAYCISVSGALPTKERTAYLYLECRDRFPLAPPNIYAEVLSATRFDEFGQAETREVALQPLAAIIGWEAQAGSLLTVTREAFAQLDESYRPTGQLSGFLNQYGDWVRPDHA